MSKTPIAIVIGVGICLFFIYGIQTQFPNIANDDDDVQKISQWNKSDLISLSTAIIGFFGLGAFVSFQLKNSEKENSGIAVMFLIIAITVVVITHLFGIFLVISGNDVIETYRLILLVTILEIIVIASLIAYIFIEQNFSKNKKSEK